MHVIIAVVTVAWVIVLGSLSGFNNIGLKESCVVHWDNTICTIGNCAGLCSSFLWSICIIPQIYKNYKRGSTKGLSLRWAVANVCAALMNLNFALRIRLPLYISISAVYMPILEMIVLFQFVLIDDRRAARNIACVIFIILILVISVFTFLWHRVPWSLTESLMWVAVVLWSVEMFPQIWMNARLSATDGQSTETILISFLGKSTNFISMFSLDLPIQ